VSILLVLVVLFVMFATLLTAMTVLMSPFVLLKEIINKIIDLSNDDVLHFVEDFVPICNIS